MIVETIICTVDIENNPHITPFGVHFEDENIIISPYKPSTTLNNILATQFAVMNMTDDVRVFAGALTGHTNWSLLPVNDHTGYRLANCLAHTVLQLIAVRDDETRPQLVMQAVCSENHQSQFVNKLFQSLPCLLAAYLNDLLILKALPPQLVHG